MVSISSVLLLLLLLLLQWRASMAPSGGHPLLCLPDLFYKFLTQKSAQLGLVTVCNIRR
jgi:hypothetical protein